MIGSRQLKRQIRDVLATLGSCRAEAAEALRLAAVHGVPKDPRDCAVAVYLNAVLGADLRVVSVLVHRRSVKMLVKGPKWYHLSHLVTVALPQALRDFIMAFDESVYPDLVREESRSSELRHAALPEA